MERIGFLKHLLTGGLGAALGYEAKDTSIVGSSGAQQQVQGVIRGRPAGVVTPQEFGASGNGRRDDTASLQAALRAASDAGGGSVYLPAGDYYFTGMLTVPEGVRITGAGYASRLLPTNRGGNTLRIAGANVTIDNVRVEGATAGGIQVRADGCRIRNVWFGEKMTQCVWLFDCEDVLVDGCTFDGCGYGVIQQRGSASNNVRIVNCVAKRMRGDFVEANCTASAPSRGWTIANCQYVGSASWGAKGFRGSTERRVIGITAVTDVVITGNIMRHWGGDAAIHLEDAGGEVVITGNVIEDGWTSGANRGYIYLLNSSQHVLIANNIIRQTDPTLPAQYAVAASSGNYSNTILVEGNRIVAGSGAKFSALNLSFQSAPMLVTGNLFDGLATGVRGNHTAGLTVSHNIFRRVGKGLDASSAGPSGGSCIDWTITGNRFSGTGAFCVKAQRNSSGTGAPERWIVSGNYFDSDALGFDTIDFLVHGNMIAAGKTLNLGGTLSKGSVRYAARDNFVVGSGASDPA